MEFIDISLTLHSCLPIWPGSSPFELNWTSRIGDGRKCNNSKFTSDAHCGTHVDAPLHFIADGHSVDQIPLEVLVGRCQVVSVSDTSVITATVLERTCIKKNTRRLLLQTENSQIWAGQASGFEDHFVYLDETAARWVAAAGIELIGIDYLSIGKYTGGEETHRILLESGIVIVEGLNLNGVAPEEYQLACLPLKIRGAEGAPARAILRPLPEKSRQGVVV